MDHSEGTSGQGGHVNAAAVRGFKRLNADYLFQSDTLPAGAGIVALCLPIALLTLLVTTT